MATVSDLLLAQTERKLKKMRDGIAAEMERLRVEFRLVEEALAKKQGGNGDRAGASKPKATPAPPREKREDGRFGGLSRQELLVLVREMNKPVVKVTDVREFLVARGIVRTADAVRVSLHRLARDGELIRQADGSFAVPSRNGRGATAEVESPGPGIFDLGSQGAIDPDG